MANVVTGKIWMDNTAAPVKGAILRIRLEEVSRADAPAREVARLEVPDFTYKSGDPPLPWTLGVGELDSKKRYEVRVHVNLNGDGEYTAGDQITTQSYPVLTQGYPSTIDIQLHRIG
jgi:uncharacterized lipoprotein YbaY